jgi:hypothetical protein
LEDACVDLDLFDTGTVELFERRDDARLLSCTRRTVYEEMWEVAALCLHNLALVSLCLMENWTDSLQGLEDDLKARDGS